MVAAERIEPSNEIYYSSIALITFIYLTAIFTFVEIRQFVEIFNFNETFFKSRQPILNIVYIISFLIVLYVLNPVTLFLSNIYGIKSTVPLFVNDLADILIFLVFFPRSWILWYHRAFADHIKNWLWRREINGQDQHFLVKYRAIMQSSHLLVYSVYLLLLLPLFVALHVLPYFNVIPYFCHFIRAGLLTLLMCVTFYSAKRISVVTDEWSIRSELLSSIKTTGVSYITAHAISLIFEHYINQQWALFIKILFVSIGDIFVIYYTCHWARKQFECLQKLRIMRAGKINHGRRSSFSMFLTTRVQFQNIMNHKNGIEAFCNHLADEFGLESMLFLIEVAQFKAITRRKSNERLPDNIPELADLHTIPHLFSAASILNATWLPIDARMYSLTPYQIALYLYDKYIEESADLCINISFGIRKEIYRNFQELSQHQNDPSTQDDDKREGFETDNELNETNDLFKVYKAFDEAFTEIWRLIQTDSFLRFKYTEEFRRLVSVLFPEEAVLANKNLIKMIDDEIQKETKKEKQKEQIISIEINKLQSSPPISHKQQCIVMELHNDFTTALTSNGDALPSCSTILEHQRNSLPSLSFTSKTLNLKQHAHSLPIQFENYRE